MAIPWGKVGLVLFVLVGAAAMATHSVLLSVCALAALGLIAVD